MTLMRNGKQRKRNMVHRNKRRMTALACFLALALTMLTGCGTKGKEEITSLDQLGEPGTKIGVPGDMLEFETLQQDYPEAKVLVYDNYPLAYDDVAKGRLDAYVYARREMEFAIENGTAGVRLLDENYSKNNVAVGLSPISPIPDLQEKINTFISELNADGTLDDMYMRWVILADDTMPKITLPEHLTVQLRVGTTGTVMPYSYYVGTELRGYDIELAYRFAAWLGADVEFKIYDFGGIVTAAETGDVDCIMSNLYYTPEKGEAIPFSDPLFDVEVTAMVRATGEGSEASDGTVSWQDYNGKRLGVLVGPLMEDTAAEFFPDSEYLYFDSYPDCAAALLTGKIDGFLGDEPGMISMHAEQPEIDYIHEPLTENNYAFAFRKDDPESAALCKELNEFLARAWADGTMDEIAEIWLGVDEARKVVDMSDLTGENGTIRVVTTSTDMPWSYIKDGKNVGYDIDLVVRFCRERGYSLELGDVDFAGRIPAVQSGKYDFTTDMNVTPEREEQVLFSGPTAHGGIVLAVRSSDLTTTGSVVAKGGYGSVDELAGKRIGVVTGTIHDSLAAKRLPTAQIVYFNTTADMIDALKAGKIDAMVRPQSGALFISYEDKSITWLDEHLTDADVSFAFPKTEDGAALRERFSVYIRELRESGELETLREKWFGEDESVKTMLDISALPATNGMLRLAATGTQMPFNYVRDNVIVGFEIELAARFCEENGFALQVEQMNFDGVLASVQAGKCDFACACLAATEERKESVDFSEPHFAESVVFVVLDSTAGKQESFLDGVRASFEKTFIRENRWQLFVEGIGTTMLITVLSILFGTALGFGVFMLCRNGNPVANVLTRFCVWLVQGMPVVVLLMILYYVIFGKIAISGTAVSVIGFTLVFGAAVYGMLKAGVGAIDRGQTEAAYALGYGNTRAFFRVILPQAIPHFLPSYKGQITALIKATAVVGYVAVQDLTKMGDIVRSRTYEAFFPLIAVAVIYFVLAAILTFFVNKVEIRIDPRKRSSKELLKGVNTDD